MDYIVNFTDPVNGSFVIKPYTTNGPDSPAAAVPLDSNAVSANTSIVLLGQGMYQYGERIAEGFVHMIEHFSFATSPAYPIQGQIWYKNDTGELFVYNGATWDAILVSGAISGDLDMGGFKIENLGNPDSPDDAVNLGYADARFVNTSGDIMTGTLTVPGLTVNAVGLNMSSLPITNVLDPVALQDAATRNYVLAQIAALSTVYVNTTGDTMTGNLIMSAGGTVTGLPSPVANSDAASKIYVDTIVGTGVSAFTDLSDVPASYVGFSNQFVRVNVGETGLEFTNNVAAAVHEHDASEVNYIVVTPDSSYAVDTIPTQIDPLTLVIDLQSLINAYDSALSRVGGKNDRHIHEETTPYTVVSVTPGLGGDWVIGPGDFTSVFIAGRKFRVSGDTGNPTSNKVYTVDTSVFAVNTTITVDALETIPAGSAGDGTIQPTVDLDYTYAVEANKLIVSNQTTRERLFASTRGRSRIDFVTPVNNLTGTGLAVGSYSFDVTIDGIGPSTITITVGTANPSFASLQTTINTQINLVPALFGLSFTLFGNAGLTIYANSVGVYSSVLVEDVDLFSSLLPNTITNYAGVDYDYEEIDLVTFSSSDVALFEAPGYAIATIDDTPAPNSTTLVGLAAASYDFTADIDGGGAIDYTVVIVGGEDLNDVATLMDTLLVGLANVVSTGNRLVIVSQTLGPTSSVVITRPTTGGNPDLFDSLELSMTATITIKERIGRSSVSVDDEVEILATR